MQILMVLDQEFPFDTRVENQAIALRNAGHTVHLACYTRENRLLREEHNGIFLHRVPLPGIIYKSSVAALTFPLYFRFWNKFLSSLLSANNFDVIHIHDLPLMKVGRDLKRKFGVLLVSDLHENWPGLLMVSTHARTVAGRILSPVFLWKRYEKDILRSADRIIVVVEEAKDRLERLGLDRGKISVVSNTLNADSFGLPDKSPDEDYFTLYYAGGITYHRGLQYVLRSVAGIRRRIPNIRIRIAGSGKYVKNLIHLTRELGLEDRIEFLGFLSLTEVAANLATADAALIPHLKTEHTDSTIPHKLFQYMYANKPVIASNCAPLERIINETGAGIIFKSGSSEDLSEKIIALAEKRVHVSPGRRWVEEKYNWGIDAENLISLYNELEYPIKNNMPA